VDTAEGAEDAGGAECHCLTIVGNLSWWHGVMGVFFSSRKLRVYDLTRLSWRPALFTIRGMRSGREKASHCSNS
jgi:hypothetical protein